MFLAEVVFMVLCSSASAQTAPTAAPTPIPSPAGPQDSHTNSSLIMAPLLSYLPAASPQTQNPIHAFAALDLYAPFGFENAQPDDDRFRVRAVELTLSARLTNDIKAVVNIASFDEDGTDDGSGQLPGNFLFQLNEAFISSATLIPETFFKVGKFYLDLGILNGEHQTEWPFPTAPFYHKLFFDKNNVVDTGLEATWSSPNRRFDIELGYTAGYNFGHDETNTGTKPVTPTSYVHPKWHSESGHLDIGLNYVDRADSMGEQTEITGYDIKYRTTNDKHASSSWLVQNETYYRFQTPSGEPLTEEVGGYIYTQHNWNPQWGAGLRVDGYSMLSLKNLSGGNRRNVNYALVPVLSYQMSDNTQIRAAYNYNVAVLGGTSDVSVQIFELQFVAEIGDILGLHD